MVSNGFFRYILSNLGQVPDNIFMDKDLTIPYNELVPAAVAVHNKS